MVSLFVCTISWSTIGYFLIKHVTVVEAQTAVSLFPVGFQGLPLSGEIQGTGTDGTTFVLSGTTLGQPVTGSTCQIIVHVHMILTAFCQSRSCKDRRKLARLQRFQHQV